MQKSTRLAQKRSQELRRAMTISEKRLWTHRRRNALGVKFRRQVPIGPYIVDFACIPAKLVIECDGQHHGGGTGYDDHRDDFLRSRGFGVLRFENAEIAAEIDHVLIVIRSYLPGAKEDPPTPGPGGRRYFPPEDGGTNLEHPFCR